jgi:hypothetical protein
VEEVEEGRGDEDEEGGREVVCGRREEVCGWEESRIVVWLGLRAAASLRPMPAPRNHSTTSKLAFTLHEAACTPSLLAMSVTAAADGLDDVYRALEAYDWDNDVEFQSGLSAILGSNSSPEQATELTLRARCFYYARLVVVQLLRVRHVC